MSLTSPPSRSAIFCPLTETCTLYKVEHRAVRMVCDGHMHEGHHRDLDPAGQKNGSVQLKLLRTQLKPPTQTAATPSSSSTWSSKGFSSFSFSICIFASSAVFSTLSRLRKMKKSFLVSAQIKMTMIIMIIIVVVQSQG